MSEAQRIASVEALDAALRHFAAAEQNYRNPSSEKARQMSKQNRQALAAQYAQWQRDLSSVRAYLQQKEKPC